MIIIKLIFNLIFKYFRAYLNKTFKQPSVYEAIRPLFATFYLFIIQCIWLSYSRINIIELEPRMFYWITGTLFSNISVSETFLFYFSIIYLI